MMEKVIDLVQYKKDLDQFHGDCGILELEESANQLCEEAWHLLVPMRLLKIDALTIDSTGSILNIQYKEDEPN
ncbi:MAG: hypothetical protein P4N59_14865 [Negativicutes bacterium]|nr:hypothetical protein [Negativicutes bacterium]